MPKSVAFKESHNHEMIIAILVLASRCYLKLSDISYLRVIGRHSNQVLAQSLGV